MIHELRTPLRTLTLIVDAVGMHWAIDWYNPRVEHSSLSVVGHCIDPNLVTLVTIEVQVRLGVLLEA